MIGTKVVKWCNKFVFGVNVSPGNGAMILATSPRNMCTEDERERERERERKRER